MAIMSGGEMVLADTSPSFARSTYWTPSGVGLADQFASYAQIYRQQLWVNTVVDKLSYNTARLPLKVFRRTVEGRSEARDTPFAQLIRRPNPKHDSFFFWLWTASTFFVYGEALWVKIRGSNGQPAELWPLHPANVKTRDVAGELFYDFFGGVSSTEALFAIPTRDVVHFKTYNPDTTARGISKIEPLRQTLLNEDSARKATASFWQRGARPAVALSHPAKISQAAADRLKAQWDAVAAGAGKTGATVVLEEGMEPKILSLNQEEAQYIATRQLNREEVCAGFDVPPPAVHILDHATYSNITEQMRSVYRDTMAPKLSLFESTVDSQLRPDFGDDSLYAEFLLDDVLRGAFETRAVAIQAAVNSAQLTPNEGRALDNRPPLEGGDRLYINSTMIPIDEVSVRAVAGETLADDGAPVAAAETDSAAGPAQQEPFDPALVDAVGTLIRSGFDPASILSALGLPPMEHLGLLPVTLQKEEQFTADLHNAQAQATDAGAAKGTFARKVAQKVAGRASMFDSLDAIDPVPLVADLNGQGDAVVALLELSKAAGVDVATFCSRMWALTGGNQ